MGLVNNIAVIITDLCEECGICNDVCPIGAVRFELPHREFAPAHDGYQAIPR
jgi:ferredoxin